MLAHQTPNPFNPIPKSVDSAPRVKNAKLLPVERRSIASIFRRDSCHSFIRVIRDSKCRVMKPVDFVEFLTEVQELVEEADLL